jgi:5-methylcytosine-specific restriction protein B
MNDKLKEFIKHCENEDSLVLFFQLVKDLLGYLGIDPDNQKIVYNVTKGSYRKLSVILNSRLILALNSYSDLWFMLHRQFIDDHIDQLEIEQEVEFTDREPIASGFWLTYEKATANLSLFKDDWLSCCKEYEPRQVRSRFLSSKMPELSRYISDPESILDEYKTKRPQLSTNVSHNQSRIQNPIQLNMKSTPLNLILYGPPGTGKTYNSINKAISIIDTDFDLTQKRKVIKAEFDRLVSEGRIAFTTFHQSMSYEDFIEGIKPQPPDSENIDGVFYDIENGIFKEISLRAGQHKMLISSTDGKEAKLNSKVFSEFYNNFAEKLPYTSENESEIKLSTTNGKEFELFKNTAGSICVKSGQKKATMSFSLDLLERVLFENGKSWHTSYTRIIIDAILNDNYYEYKEVDISLHPFVLIIDEINRGNIAQIFGELITLIEEDKRLGNEESLEAILPYSKEKFGIPRNLYIIGTMNTADRSVEALDTALRRRFSFEEIWPNADLISNEIPEVDLKSVMIKINARIEKLLDKDHLIGHSYFMKVENLTDLKEVFQRNIIPLLQEYFFGDFGKIGLVLGTGFVEKIENESNRIFAKFYDYESSDLEDRPVYRIQKVSEMDDEHFITALNTLLTNDRE